MRRDTLWDYLRKILTLNLLCGLWLLSSAFLLGIQEGFESYLLEISLFTLSIETLFVYCCGLCIYSLSIEFILRFIQRALSKKMNAVVTIILTALVYTLCHWRHGWSGVVYALPIGVITAWKYHRWRDWKVFAFWHLQWDFLALSTFIILSMFNIPPYSDAVQFSYKKSLMKAHRVVYREGAGWIDTAHYWGAHRRACDFHKELLAGRNQMNVLIIYKDLFGLKGTDQFTLYSDPRSPKNIRERAKSLTLRAALREETWQAESSYLSGMRLSAWSSEDIRSVKVALSDIQSDQFWSECAQRQRPMPKDFMPIGIEKDEQKRDALWPTFQDFVKAGLP